MLAARATSSPVTAQDLPASCDRADPATCLYTSDRAYDVGEIDGVQLTDTARANYDLLLVIRYPVGAPGPRPVVIWHHGGNPSASRATRGEEWSRNLAAAGYVVVHPSRTMIADPTPFGAECRDNGFKVPRRMHILGDAEPHALRADPIAVAELARLLGNADGAAGEVVQHAFPRLFHASYWIRTSRCGSSNRSTRLC